ncbi:hypothetical protein B0H14DRAFT_3703247 [Mycena olivaceomarginata]|nr:hypothetical protein B0H14DRAFT_3703247 [Mycena olivaceomarginata]
MSQAVDEDREELARFREEWKKEVERKKNPQPEPGPSKQRPELVLAEYDLSETTSSGTATPGPSSETISGTPAALATGSKYFDASNHEQSGQLDTALSLYRQAFRLEPNVDRAYHTQEILASIKAGADDGFIEPEGRGKTSTTLRRLCSVLLRSRLVFEPEDEEQPFYINVLPEELLINILRKLDHNLYRALCWRSAERHGWFELGSWYMEGTRCTVLQAASSRQLGEQVPVVAQFQSDFRRVYMEHPRVRLDGVYIAVCHYVYAVSFLEPPNFDSSQFPRIDLNSAGGGHVISHLITYHRYLRFFPDGKVLSLLANEETQPAQVIHTLKPSLRKKVWFIYWHVKLSGSVITISNLIDASGRFPIPPISTPGNDQPFCAVTRSA